MSLFFRVPCSAILLLIIFSSPGFSQNEAERLISSIRNRDNIIVQEYNFPPSDVHSLINLFENELPNLNIRDRYTSYFYLQRIALSMEDVGSQTELLDFFVKVALKDSDLGNRRAAIKLLYSFPFECVDERIKNSLSVYVVNREKPFSDYARLAAWFRIYQIEVPLLQALQEGDLSNKERWELRLALGRIGNPESIQYCMEMIRSAGINDLVVNTLVPEIIYLNQREGVDYLLMKVLDDEKQCSSPNPEVDTQITCAYRLMEALAPEIVGFPIEVDASGDLLTDDYELALNEVRQWINENYQTYQIKN